MRSNRLRSWSPIVPLLVPLLVLAGLFGMHGPGDHPLSSATHSGAHSFVHESMAVHEVGTANPGGAVLSPLGGDGSSGALTSCCVAVLLVGLLAGLFLGRDLRRTSWDLRLLAWLRAPVPRIRAPDPPTPLLLSVCRC